MEYLIVPMEPQHLDACVEIEHTAQDPWNAAQLAEELSCQMEGGASRIYLAVEPSTQQVVGLAAWQLAGDEASLNTLTVDPAHRRRGIGRQLLRQSLALLAQQGAAYAFLEVRHSNLAAQGLYESVGFSVQGLRRNFYSAPREDALVMSCDEVQSFISAQQEADDVYTGN